MLLLSKIGPLYKQLLGISKKLALVFATSMPVIEVSKEEVVPARVPYIHFPFYFQKDTNKVRALINSGSKVNVMKLAYASKLSFRVYQIDVRAQKIDGSILKTFDMVLASFQVEDKFGRAWFFQETFLLADISMEVVLGIPFFTLSNTDIQFAKKELIWRSYTVVKALTITNWVEIINKKELAKAVLDKNVKAFVVHVISLSLSTMSIYLAREA